ncbi:DNA-binding protein [Paenibacillus alvei]|uniref:DNA-binding protein n=1 Tax=Paenibacillus alvei TaxID=44250 RepID=UPI003D2794B8
MAGVAKITKEQIFAAAEAIQAEGKNPTLAAVRAAVGGGSFTTISEAMTEWKAAQAVSDTPIREPLPPALDEASARLMFEVWGVAMGMANDRLKSEREALEVARAEHEQAQAETAEMADQLAEEIDALRMENESLKETLDESIKDTVKAREELHVEQIKSSKLQTRLDSLEEQIKELRGEKDRLVKANEEYAKEMRSFVADNAKMSSEIDKLRSLCKEKDETIKNSARDNGELLSESGQLRKEVERLRVFELENAKLESKIEQLQKHSEKQQSVFQSAILDAVKAAAEGSAHQSSKKIVKPKGDDTNDK